MKGQILNGNPGQSHAVRPPVTPIRKKSARVIKWTGAREARYRGATVPLRGPGTKAAARRRWKCQPVVRTSSAARHDPSVRIDPVRCRAAHPVQNTRGHTFFRSRYNSPMVTHRAHGVEQKIHSIQKIHHSTNLRCQPQQYSSSPSRSLTRTARATDASRHRRPSASAGRPRSIRVLCTAQRRG